jgi:hypothetical protein
MAQHRCSSLALFTFGLFIATWFLYRATRDLVMGAEIATEKQLKLIAENAAEQTRQMQASINAQMGAHGRIPGRIHTYRLAVVLKNGGMTPRRDEAGGG